MVDQVFKSPGYFDREIDLSARTIAPSGIPAAIVGTSLKGPAFVPTTLGAFPDFQTRFGDLNPKFMAPYAVEKWLDNKFAATFVRVLGAGANTTGTDFSNTQTMGIVKNSGFALVGSTVGGGDSRNAGVTQFLVAKHTVTGTEAFGMPMFSDNNSFFTTGSTSQVYLVRGMLFTAYDTRIMVMSASDTFAGVMDDFASLDLGPLSQTYLKFKLIISSSQGASYSTGDGFAGLRILTASLNPSSQDYIGNILNTDPEKFETERHVLYCNFALDDEIATVSTDVNSIAIVSGSANTSATSGDATLVLRNAFGRFDTRYTSPKTSWFISQPFGQTEYNLFYVEALDDGAYANNKFKISIANIKMSADPRYQYGTFSLLVRAFGDSDVEPQILEQYNNLTLDPSSDNYIAKIIGDSKMSYTFDILDPDDRRLVRDGNHAIKSSYIRVVMDSQVTRKMTPVKAVPFGFRGIKALDTNSILTDALPVGATSGSLIRLAASGSTVLVNDRLLSAIVPPIPYRFKVTRGNISTSSAFTGYPGTNEVVDARLFWGVKFERNTSVLNTNVSNEPNHLIESMTKFQGIEKLDVLVTGSKTDDFNSSKFTLAKVCLSNLTLSDVTGSPAQHMKEAAYIRNGVVNTSDYTVADTNGNRVTLASLLIMSVTASDFNRFSDYTKFSTVMYGGWDGNNILDKNANRMNDKGTSTESGGCANGSYTSPGFATNQNGTGRLNGTIYSYQTAVKIVTDPLLSQHNILAIPGQREPFVTDDAGVKTQDHTLSMYLMDVPCYKSDNTRIFDGVTGSYVDVNNTADMFESRVIDNNSVAAYFPNFVMDDLTNSRKVTVPATVGALAAIGYNDKVAFPWFAPAGFNRAALNFVNLAQVKINQADKDRLYDVRLNTIMKFPREGYVIMSQKTLQQQKSALSSMNVKRMLLEVKRSVIDIGNRIIWDQISDQTRTELVKQITAVLTSVQTKAGIEQFRVICDNTNNTKEDVESNKMNCQIKMVPTRAVEFISIDFIISRSGVAFV